MKHSTISLDDLRGIRPQIRNIRTETVGLVRHRVPENVDEFRESLEKALNIYKSLEVVSLGDSSREKYVNDAMVKTQEFLATSPDKFEGVKQLLMVSLVTKPILDLIDGHRLLSCIKSRERRSNRPEFVQFMRSLQQEDVRRTVAYISTYETNKSNKILDFKERNPYASEIPTFKISGDYQKGFSGRMYTVRSFGELFQPKLRLLGTKKTTLDRIRSNLLTLPIKPEYQALLINNIQERVPEDVFSAHPLNLRLFAAEFELINDIESQYLKEAGLQDACTPHLEWNAIVPAILQSEVIGDKPLYDVITANAKIDFVNAQFIPLSEELDTPVLGNVRRYYGYVPADIPMEFEDLRVAQRDRMVRQMDQYMHIHYGDEKDIPVFLLAIETGGNPYAEDIGEGLKELGYPVKVGSVAIDKYIEWVDEGKLLREYRNEFKDAVVIIVDDATYTGKNHGTIMKTLRKDRLKKLLGYKKALFAAPYDTAGLADFYFVRSLKRPVTRSVEPLQNLD